MGLERRILAVTALLALSACDRGVPSGDRGASSPPKEEEVSRIAPIAPIVGKPNPSVEIAEPDGGAKALPAIGTGRLTLARILAIARERVPGEVIEVELDDDDGRSEYEVKILTADGRSIELKIDALSGVVLKSEED